MNNKAMKFLATILLTITILAAGCTGQRGTSIPDSKPDIYGTITSMKRTTSKTEKGKAIVLVEAVSGIQASYENASVKIDGNTYIEDSTGSLLKIEQLKEYQLVEVWFDHPVMESYPVQAHAAAIRVR